MKTRDLSPSRTFAVILFVIFFIILGLSIYYQKYRPILIVLLGANLLMFLKYCLDYFDYYRLSVKTRIYSEKKPTDTILNFHLTKFYLGAYALRVEADGVRIADISKGRNAQIPIPNKTQHLTISMRGTPNVIELTDYSPDIVINAWVKYCKDQSRELMATITNVGEKFDETRIFKAYSYALRLRQRNAGWGIVVSFIPMIILIVFIIMPIF